MASHAPFVLLLATLLLLAAPAIQAKTATSSPPAPSPEAAPALNVSGILAKSGNFNFFIRLLNTTRINEQINSQLIDSLNGLTIFAPTDDAFRRLKAGTINDIGQQDQIQLVLYHVLPRYYSLTDFQTASNPINTEASGEDGVYTFNVTTSSDGQQANVSTGIVKTPIAHSVYATLPLAVYAVDNVLLPYDIFGAKAPASSKKAPAGKAGAAADNSSPATESSKDSGAGLGGRRVEWSLLAGLGIASFFANVLW